MVYYNTYITGWYNPLYNPTNQGFFRDSNVVLHHLEFIVDGVFDAGSRVPLSQTFDSPLNLRTEARKKMEKFYQKKLMVIVFNRIYQQKK